MDVGFDGVPLLVEDEREVLGLGQRLDRLLAVVAAVHAYNLGMLAVPVKERGVSPSV